MELSGLGEFGLIDLIQKRFADIKVGSCEGIGDDCAVIPLNDKESLVVTTDLLIEKIHFLREAVSPHELGRKSLAVNLSDVAAMGAAPYASFLSVALPPDISSEWIEAFVEGYHSLSAEFSVPLLGGDTTSSKEDLSISVTAIGRAVNTHLKRRGDARVGDTIFVTGYLGDSARGLQQILDGQSDIRYTALHNNPKPFVKEGIWLGNKSDVHAMMDLSDGLASDLLHILHASGVSAEVSLESIPTNTSIEQAVSGGEDYKLLFTVQAENARQIAEDYHTEFGEQLHAIGRITEGIPEITWLDNGQKITPQWSGFTHF